MRYLCIDLGDKRTGIAAGDDVTRIATPVEAVNTANPQERLRQLLKIIEREGPDALVVGLPLNMDGSEGPSAAKVRDFIATLAEQTKLTVHAFDERLTSAAADEQMAQSGLTHKQKKARRDALAAAAILRGFFERLKG
jgi:putative Holliday junction resolvase